MSISEPFFGRSTAALSQMPPPPLPAAAENRVDDEPSNAALASYDLRYDAGTGVAAAAAAAASTWPAAMVLVKFIVEESQELEGPNWKFR